MKTEQKQKQQIKQKLELDTSLKNSQDKANKEKNEQLLQARSMKRKQSKKRFVFTGGLNKYKRNFLENLSILLSAGMDILSCLKATEEEFSSHRMKKIIRRIIEKIEGGDSLWRALDDSQLFSNKVLSLIRIGEESGKLIENINTVVDQQEKEWIFKTKIRSAMLYPAIVLPLTLFVGIGVAWFALPKLTDAFYDMNAQLPFITRILMKVGEFLAKYGAVFVPIVIFSFIIILYFLFSFPKTKAIGQIFIFKMPIFRRLIREVELARVGYILNGLLKAGIPITDSLQSLQDSTTFYSYKKFYKFLYNNIDTGNSFKKSFSAYKNSEKLIPKSIQYMIISGEESGKLLETLDRIGRAYETKIEISIKDISTLMEPILLIIIGLAVATIALAVFLPIYNLTQII